MKKKYKHVRAFLLDNWYVGLIVFVGSAIAISLLLVQLGSLVGGLSADEFQIQQQISSNPITFKDVLEQPLFLPYMIGLYLVQFLPFSGPTTLRSVGAVFGLLGALGFFYTLNKWYSLRMAIFGTALFATSSWFLHTARYASPEVSYLLLPLLIAGFVGLQAKTRSKWIALAVILFGFMALYIPGLVWLLVPAAILQRKVILDSIKLQRLWFNILSAVLCLLMLVPLVYSLIMSDTPSTIALDILGLPNSLAGIGDIGKNLLHSLGDVFAYSNLGALHVPGHLPWLDITTVTLVLLGSIQFGRYYRLDRSKLFLIAMLVGLVLASFNSKVNLVILLPFIYLLAVEGLRWLLNIWLQVFPKNPFARSFGVIVMALIVISVGVYQTNKYFLAWGQSPETQAQFNKLP